MGYGGLFLFPGHHTGNETTSVYDQILQYLPITFFVLVSFPDKHEGLAFYTLNFFQIPSKCVPLISSPCS